MPDNGKPPHRDLEPFSVSLALVGPDDREAGEAVGLEVLEVPGDEFADTGLVGGESDGAVVGLAAAEATFGEAVQESPRVGGHREERKLGEILAEQAQYRSVWFAERVWHAGHDRVTLKECMRNEMQLLALVEAAFEVSNRGGMVGIPALQDADEVVGVDGKLQRTRPSRSSLRKSSTAAGSTGVVPGGATATKKRPRFSTVMVATGSISRCPLRS